MEIRRALPVDYSRICELAAANYEKNLSPSDRQQGFLSAKFSLRQVTDMASDLGIIVARDNNQVVGFVCASRCDWDDQPPIVKSMLTEFDRILFQGRPLNEQRLFIYGPVCIDRAYRGQGLLRKLYQGIKRELAGKYYVGSAFIAEGNSRSLKAHLEGLGMTKVARFTHDDRSYRILAFHVEAGNDAIHANEASPADRDHT